LPIIFDAIDANRDGGIEMHEFKNYFLSFGINDDNFTQMVFENIDVDGDGDLSKEGKYLRFKIIGDHENF